MLELPRPFLEKNKMIVESMSEIHHGAKRGREILRESEALRIDRHATTDTL